MSLPSVSPSAGATYAVTTPSASAVKHWEKSVAEVANVVCVSVALSTPATLTPTIAAALKSLASVNVVLAAR